MNLILLEPDEADRPLPAADPRAVHLVKILRRREGDRFDAGIVNGPRGKGTVISISAEGIRFRFEATAEPQEPDLIHLLVALPRPQTARKVLGEATALGVSSIRFFQSEKGDPGYASSTLWRTPEWRRHLLDGATQAFDTRIPDLQHAASLEAAVSALPAAYAGIALDNYEATRRLTAQPRPAPLALAFGPERGWSAAERDILRGAGFELAHLGTRVLRTETAVVAALAIVKATG